MARVGYLKLWRSLVDKPIWKQSTPEHKAILIQLLVMADYTGNEWEYKNETYKTEPGQFVTSLKNIAEECGKGISVQNVRSALARFERLGFITNKSTKSNRLITIVNWGFYQSNDNITNKGINNVSNSLLTNDQQRGNKEVTTKEEVKKKRSKEIKNIKKEDSKSVFDFFQENGFGVLSAYTTEDISQYLDAFENDSEAIVIMALKVSLDRNKVRWSYAKGILKDWIHANLKSASDVVAYEQRKLIAYQNKVTPSAANQSREKTPEWLLKQKQGDQKAQQETSVDFEERKRAMEAEIAEFDKQFRN
ncbi:DnaD domain protein [Mammaliicoccus sciuri]|uniref:DnaD domain protein n=1 Tax=Mammaliicoccus sciuri TaxID=1296 RepID=UPI000D1E7398|nr:DnaD domain protein [Mammaliicoccus sciuri]PTJ69572.1 DNA replication protein DnaD [Mammaliicoccus sciuri]